MFAAYGRHVRGLCKIITHHIAERRNDQNDSDAERSAADGLLDNSKGADDNQADEHESQTCHVDRGSADARKQEPADDTADEVAARKRNVDIESVDFAESGLSQAELFSNLRPTQQIARRACELTR